MHTTWQLKTLLPSDSQISITKVQQQVEKDIAIFVTKWLKNNHYLTKPEVLLPALIDYENLVYKNYLAGNLGFYHSLSHALNEPDTNIKAKLQQLEDWWTKLYNQVQFFPLRLAKADPKSQAKFLRYPKLKIYRHFLEKLFVEAQHLLSEPEEKLLNLVSPSATSAWTRMVSSFLTKEERRGIPFSGLISLLSDPDKQVRDQAAFEVAEILEKHSEIAEAEINAVFTYKKHSDELRQFSRPDSGRLLSDDIDPKIVDSLRKVVSQNFSLSQDFYALKARLLGQKHLDYHERNVPIGSIQDKYSYPDSLALVLQVFQKLDPEFSQILNQFSEKGQIDVYPKKGKTGGAFCTTRTLDTPTYILLNHTDKLQDVLTLAHEAGHGINNELMRQSQTLLNFDTPLATAEVASTFFEDFVLEELEKKANPQQRLSLYMTKLGDDISTIFRQVACYQFEHDLHQAIRKNSYLSKDDIGKIFIKNMSAYMGPAVKQNFGAEFYWVYWSHIRNPFYVYSYASGLLISKSLQAMVRKNPKDIAKVKEFLSSGTSLSPKSIFLKMGIDITKPDFWEQGIAEIRSLLAQAESLSAQIKA